MAQPIIFYSSQLIIDYVSEIGLLNILIVNKSSIKSPAEQEQHIQISVRKLIGIIFWYQTSKNKFRKHVIVLNCMSINDRGNKFLGQSQGYTE